jgi:hypothetical protein
MICQTRLLTFYWGRLGYESHSLPSQRQDFVGNIPHNSAEESTGVATPEPSKRAESQTATSAQPMG